MYIVTTKLHLMQKGEWSFGNDYARNVTIFSVDNDSSSRPNNPKNIF